MEEPLNVFSGKSWMPYKAIGYFQAVNPINTGFHKDLLKELLSQYIEIKLLLHHPLTLLRTPIYLFFKTPFCSPKATR